MKAAAIVKNPIHLLAFGFGSGLSPLAPGTVGTLIAVLIYLPLGLLPLELYWAAVAAAFLAGLYLCGKTAKDLEMPDHRGIVWDEFTGFWIAMAMAPAGWAWLAAGFALFRLFDILKPFPIAWLDKNIGGGLGIMLDDAAAGLYAGICLKLMALVCMYG